MGKVVVLADDFLVLCGVRPERGQGLLFGAHIETLHSALAESRQKREQKKKEKKKAKARRDRKKNLTCEERNGHRVDAS